MPAAKVITPAVGLPVLRADTIQLLRMDLPENATTPVLAFAYAARTPGQYTSDPLTGLGSIVNLMTTTATLAVGATVLIELQDSPDGSDWKTRASATYNASDDTGALEYRGDGAYLRIRATVGGGQAAFTSSFLLTALPPDENASLDLALAAAVEDIQDFAERQFNNATFRVVAPAFAPTFKLAPCPVLEIVSVKYRDEAGTLRTLDPSNYQLAANQEPAILAPAHGKTWPATDPEAIEAVIIEFSAGYDGDPIPARATMAIHFAAAHLFVNRTPDRQPTTPGLPNHIAAIAGPLRFRLPH